MQDCSNIFSNSRHFTSCTYLPARMFVLCTQCTKAKKILITVWSTCQIVFVTNNFIKYRGIPLSRYFEWLCYRRRKLIPDLETGARRGQLIEGEDLSNVSRRQSYICEIVVIAWRRATDWPDLLLLLLLLLLLMMMVVVVVVVVMITWVCKVNESWQRQLWLVDALKMLTVMVGDAVLSHSPDTSSLRHNLRHVSSSSTPHSNTSTDKNSTEMSKRRHSETSARRQNLLETMNCLQYCTALSRQQRSSPLHRALVQLRYLQTHNTISVSN